jgi:hypothetical protein
LAGYSTTQGTLMQRITMRVSVAGFVLPAVFAASLSSCAGRAYLPGHPELEEEQHEAILEGVFITGMNLEQRDVITNPRRKGITGNGYWRSSDMGDEIRYRWYVANEREPFRDGRGRLVCELVFVDSQLNEVAYCAGD